MRKIVLIQLIVMIVLAVLTPTMAAERPYYQQEGYLVIGMTTNSLMEATREFDVRKNQGFTDVHLRDKRYWAKLIANERYAVVYNVCADYDSAQTYANQLRPFGIDTYIKHSGRSTHGPLGDRGYFVIGTCSTDKNETWAAFESHKDVQLVNMFMCYSANYEGFAPGYIIEAFGVFPSADEAKEYAEYIKSLGIDVYVKYGAWKG